uniref:YadA family autotransporter adhesin n=1 Tax=Paraburkholderia bannensis TaxID=765414 RepID=UPI002AB6EEB1|nr:YadA family autotransporter adhesin [Paraburkholderia bannensis]
MKMNVRAKLDQAAMARRASLKRAQSATVALSAVALAAGAMFSLSAHAAGEQLGACASATTSTGIAIDGADSSYCTNATGTSAIAIGSSARAGGSSSAAGWDGKTYGDYDQTAVGVRASATGGGAVAFGADALSSGTRSTAVGSQAQATGASSAAFGDGSSATGLGAVAAGADASASATGAAAFGAGASASAAGALALGEMSKASVANGIAIGNGASASTVNSVALGANSVTAAAVATSSALIGGNSYSFAGAAPVGVVSVGAAGAERQVTNVAAGQLNAGSTDAVNGSQLYATNQQVTQNTADISGLSGQMADAVMYDSSAHDSVTLGGVGATTPVALHNVAAGAVNASSFDAVNGSQLFGLASSTASALGGGSSVNADGSISAPQYAVGGQTFSNAGDAFSNLDGRTTANADAISNLQGQMADGVVYDSSAHNAVTFGGVGATTPVALHNVAAGALSAVSTDAVNGSQLYATNQQVAQNTSDIADLQTNVSNLGGKMADAVSYDSSAHDSITLGGAGATTPVALHNVAAGTADTDAVNVGQMNDAIAAVSQEAANAANPFIAANGDRATEGAVASGTHATAVGPNAVASGNQATALGANASASGANSVALGAGSVADRDNTVSVGSAGNERQITNVAAGTAGTDAVNVNQLNAVTAQSQGYVDSRIAGVQKQVSDVQKEAFGAAAAAMAVASLPQPTQPGKTMVAAGASRIGGQTGAALGVSYVTENNKWVGKLAASSSSQGNTGVTVGAGYQW